MLTPFLSRLSSVGKAMFSLIVASILIAQAGCNDFQAPETTSKLHAPVDFNGVWQFTEWDEAVRPENVGSFTEEGKRRNMLFEENFNDAEDSAENFCFFTGMPWTVLTRARDYPTEIYQTDDRMIMFFEGMDMVRQVHFDVTEVPKGYVASNQGYSIGHWEGDELVIVTRGLTATNEVFPDKQHRTEDAVVTERWKKYQHEKYGEVIEIDVTLDDPEIYAEPAHGHNLWKRAPEGRVVGGYNCPNALWDDFVAEKMERADLSRFAPVLPYFFGWRGD